MTDEAWLPRAAREFSDLAARLRGEGGREGERVDFGVGEAEQTRRDRPRVLA